jgi:predicted regulator of Ras-like GTPase activity (Roadblock/LC7/MglB family)
MISTITNRTRKATPLLSIDFLLKQLVSQVKGATGAILLEADGEAVQWYAVADSDRLRLRGAYAAVVFKSCRAAAIRATLGGTRSLVLDYDRSSLLVRQIDHDCFVVLELDPSANTGHAMFRLEPTVVKLRSELAS